MVAEVVLGWLCITIQHELVYAQFVGQRHCYLLCLQLLLDTLLEQWQMRWMEWETCFLMKSSSSGLPFLEPHLFYRAWSLVLFYFSLASPALPVPWSPSFIFFSLLTSVYNMCKCGGAL
jgi:hypothetical protein